MEQIAIISDVHGNLEALKSVLKDIQERPIKHLFCLGDSIAKGVHSHACLALLRTHCDLILQGNCDAYFANPDTPVNQRVLFNRQVTTAEDRQFLLSCPFSYEFYLSGALVRLVHASPWSQSTLILPDSDLETKWKMFQPTAHTSPLDADILIYGHIHMPFSLPIAHHTLINAGSVGNALDLYQDAHHTGNPQQTAQACYLIIEGHFQDQAAGPISFTHVKVPYAIDKELSSPIPNPEKEAYARELRYGLYRDQRKR